MSTGSIEVSRHDGIATLTITRPHKRNSMTLDMWREVPRILTELADDDAIAVVILTGAQGIFCAGSDIQDLTTLHTSTAPVEAEEALAAFPKPVIAAIGGVCMGGGCQIAAACDIRIAAEDSRFSIPPAKLGIVFPASGMSRLLWLIGPSALKHLIFTGDAITATRALHIGLVDEVVSPDTLDDRARHVAQTIASRSQLTVQATKEQIRALTSGSDAVDVTQAWYDEAESGPDMPEGLSSFAERRTPAFTWTQRRQGWDSPTEPSR